MKIQAVASEISSSSFLMRNRCSYSSKLKSSFRTAFDYDKPIFWYPPHQSKALQQLRKGIHHIDVVVEVRDARLPLSSINTQFDNILLNRDRIVVYTKSDLADGTLRNALKEALLKYRNEDPIFLNALKPKGVMPILEALKEKCRLAPHRFPYMSLVVVGIPNVGKSTIINSLRHLGVKKGKVTQVGAVAGVTRRIQTRVKIWEDPPIYLYDTPGIYDPHVGSPLEGMKIALAGSTRDHLTQTIHVADYLLFRLNQSPLIKSYPKILGLSAPTDDINQLLGHICQQYNYDLPERSRIRTYLTPTGLNLSNLSPQGRLLLEQECRDFDRAANHFIGMYRKGLFGALTLDDCSAKGLKAWFETVSHSMITSHN